MDIYVSNNFIKNINENTRCYNMAVKIELILQ